MSKASRFLRLLVLWLAICTLSAAPGFIMALMMGPEAHVIPSAVPMILVIIMFAIGYAWICCTGIYYRVRANARLYASFYAGFKLRLAYSALMLVFGPLLFIPGMLGEVWIGMYSVMMSENLLRHTPIPWTNFSRVLIATLIHAVTLNICILAFVGLHYSMTRNQRIPARKLGRQRFFGILDRPYS